MKLCLAPRTLLATSISLALLLGAASTGRARQGDSDTTAPRAATAAKQETQTSTTQLAWLAFPDPDRFTLKGLAWFEENKPQLWRFPASVYDGLPHGVQRSCKCPAGGRIAFHCDSTRLALKVFAKSKSSREGFDLYADGKFVRSVLVKEKQADSELLFFEGLEKRPRQIEIYLPGHQEVTVRAVGVDKDAAVAAAEPPRSKGARGIHDPRKALPIVYYGSSVCQGTGTANPGMSYEAILARALKKDFVNLGFGGAGKAETRVVDLVSSLSASCYVLDLGKSYGMQSSDAYLAMLRSLRRAHPATPIVCVTPITSKLEVTSSSYARKSQHTRQVVREAVEKMQKSGEKALYLVEGEKLLGFGDHHTLSKDGVHPASEGFELIAKRLLPTLKEALDLK